VTDDRLWTAEEVGRFLNRSAREVLERLRYQNKFPRAIVLPASRRAHPLWVPSEVKEWALRQREPDKIPTSDRKPLITQAA
jgi:hypothetical protein